MEVQEHIISTASRMFVQLGYKRVTMDDIARELSMSKKTLYQYFKDKKDIVSAATRYHLLNEEKLFHEFTADCDNAIEYLVRTSKFMRQHISGINPCAFIDLQKYYPAAWQIFDAFKRDFIFSNIYETLERGKEEGYFRNDIQSEILAIMRMEQVPMAFDQQLFPRQKFEALEVQQQFLKHFVEGILTEEGRSLLEKYKHESYDSQDIIF